MQTHFFFGDCLAAVSGKKCNFACRYDFFVMERKVVLITGASSGFGKAMAAHLSAADHIVYGTSRRVQSSPAYCTMLQMDVTDEHSVAAAVSRIIETEGRIDVLVNNAGIGIGGAAELAADNEIALQMDTNFFGVVRLCSCVLPHMRSRRSGLIINVSSIGGVFGIPYQGLYSASKFAVEGYSEALSLETVQFGIRVVLIEPGDFNTGFTGNRRISAATLADADYASSFARVLKHIEHDESHGGNPDYLAQKVAEIVAAKRPKLRYVITPDWTQRFSVLLSKLMCGRHFQAVLKRFYGV